MTFLELERLVYEMALDKGDILWYSSVMEYVLDAYREYWRLTQAAREGSAKA